MGMMTAFAAILAWAPAQAGQFSAYDRSFTITAAEAWNICPVQSFPDEKARPALCLFPVSEKGGTALLIVDLARNQAYDAMASLGEIARRDLAQRRQRAPQAEFSALQSIQFRKGLSGFGFGMRSGAQAWDTFYFSLGAKRYYATCRGDWKKDCLAALSTAAASRQASAREESRGPRFAPKTLQGISLLVPPGWTVRQDTQNLFLMQGPGGDFQIRVPLLPGLIPSDPAGLEKAIREGLASGCPAPAAAEAALASRPVGTGGLGRLSYAVCADSKGGRLLFGVLSLTSTRRFLVAQDGPREPAAQALRILVTFEAGD